MSDNTIIQQGHFTSTGVARTINLRSDVDWMETWNLTTSAAATQWSSTYHFWHRDMPFGDHIIDYHAAATQAISRTTGIAGFNGAANRAGFYLINSGSLVPSAPIALAAGTNVTSPVYTATLGAGIANGSIVRIQSATQTNINGLDFTVTVQAGVGFTLVNTLATAPGAVSGAGTWRMIAPDVATYKLFYPSNRVIANITAANPAVVTTLVDHGYTTGQVVRMRVPAGCGMIQMDGLLGTVTNLTAGTFAINIDSTLFTAFAFPTVAAVPFTPAEVVPVGDTTGETTAGAMVNQGYMGIILGSGGAVSGTPTGVNGDIIKWRAGKSFNV